MCLKSLQQESSYTHFFKKSNLIKIMVELENLNIVDVNELASAFYEYTYEEFVSLNLKDLDIDLKDNIVDLLNSNIDFITRYRTFTNSIRDIKIKVEQIIEKRYAILIHIDISKEKYALTHLINHNRELEIVLDNLPFAAWFKNVKGQYTVVNKQFESYSGHLKEEILYHTDHEIFLEDKADKYVNSDKIALSGGTFLEEETGLNEIWMETYKCAVYDKNGNVIGTTGFTRDITSRKLKDKALHESEQKEKQLLKETIELKDNFITLITHEFKTPIAIINAAIQTIEQVCSNEFSARVYKYISKIKQNSLRQQRLVDNLLDITRLKAGIMKLNLANIDIAEATREITDSVRVYALRKDIRIIFSSSIQHEWVMIDLEKYERILLNLLSNAIKYTLPTKHINVKLSIDGFFIRLEIKDRGFGIAKEKHDLIFDKFEQVSNSLCRQAEGTGIGLYLVKSFTEALGGTISLISKEGYGSTFTVLLPLIRESSAEVQTIKKENIRNAASVELSDII